MTFTLSDLLLLLILLVVAVVACRRLIARGSAWLVGPLILGLLGTGCFLLAAMDGWTSWRLVHGNRYAQGTVIRIEVTESTYSSTDPDHLGIVHDSVTRQPVVRFRPQEYEREVVFTALGHKSGKTEYAVGDKVEVLYTPEQPEHARLAIFGDLWMPAIIFLAVGIVFGLTAWGIWLLWRKIEPLRRA